MEDVLIFCMSVLEILTDPHPLLHQPADEVVDFNEQLQELVNNMIHTLREKGFDGLGGLAAPQVGVLQQVFVLILPNQDPIIVVNPKVISTSGGTSKAWEYCYSVPGKRGRIRRHRKAIIEFQNQFGNKQKQEVADFVGRMYLHEIDHLGGILWTDLIEGEGDVMTEAQWREARARKRSGDKE
ncbi:peptide deformylase [Candidatus Dojkabacteria bacterium]|uniref:Peptide deformylase n=1 Tax=Candidatus Dojkabacteria bacterium TaxID=2099670 RepID=A0A955KZI0_9BACT|nr:peptide deformylase [Candidatus Dojkabacteria bacterium]